MSNHIPQTPSFRLDGKRALVTGASKGIGRAAAHALAGAGAHVIASARGAADLQALVDEIAGTGGSVEALVLDASDIEASQAVVAEMDPVHVLFNNAGTNKPALTLDVTPQDYDSVTNLNVRGAFFMAQAVARRMIEAGIKGSIINTSSQMGHVGGPKRSVYCATKFAVEGFTKCMAAEWGPHGIRVNTLCPTFIVTPMTEPFLEDPEFEAKVMSSIMVGRLGQVEDIMGAILFLASDASGLVTGSPLMVDGGWTAV